MTESIPDPSEYRLATTDIDPSRCLGRHLGDYLTRDTRWKPAVCYEVQCMRPPLPQTDLCHPCKTKCDKKHKQWYGRVTEDPPAHCRMLGTEWSKKCKWIGDSDIVLPPQPLPYVAEESVGESMEVHSANESAVTASEPIASSLIEPARSLSESPSVENIPEMQATVTPLPEPIFYIADFPTEPPKSSSREGPLFFPRKVLFGIGMGVLSAYFLYKLFYNPVIPFPDVEPVPVQSTPYQRFLFLDGLIKKWTS
jgi:hypothetical protein